MEVPAVIDASQYITVGVQHVELSQRLQHRIVRIPSQPPLQSSRCYLCRATHLRCESHRKMFHAAVSLSARSRSVCLSSAIFALTMGYSSSFPRSYTARS